MRRLLRIARRIGYRILDGLAADHTWSWGYVFGAPLPYARHTAHPGFRSSDSDNLTT